MRDEIINLIIFDMDGVLVDACEWHRVALNDALKEVCNYEISIQDHYNIFNGIPTKVKLKKLSEMGIIEESLFEKIETIKQEKTIQAISKFAKLRKEKISLMKFLKEKNIKIACYTNSIRATTELMLEKTGILKYFDLLITNQDVIKAKPDPEGYLLCLKTLNISSKNTIIIEDSPKGIEAAEQTGCFLIKVKNPDEVNIELLKDVIK
jgi:HAD superfamily hydrolase (TIGR01509 family)